MKMASINLFWRFVMIPVEIRLKDFEAYIKDAKSFLRAIKVLHISTFLLVVVSALLTTYLLCIIF